MKILFSSYAFAPSVGGIETVSALLAREFIVAGHEIVLTTETPAAGWADERFPVLRNPSLDQLAQALRWCDVLFENNISLRHLIPALLVRKRALVVHQTWMRNTRGEIGWNDRLKRLLVRRVRNVAISQAIACDIDAPAEIIGNPYDDATFKRLPELSRNRDIVFVGRLVSDKGVDLLLRAVEMLKRRDVEASLTIVGSGAEEQRLHQLARELMLDVTFTGPKSGAELAQILNRHQVIAIPSRWPEPFGVVALEGIACGCIPIGSEQGGLAEAIGNCGLTFRNGDAEQLADRLEELLAMPALREKFRAAAPSHLERFRAPTVARRYLQILRELAP